MRRIYANIPRFAEYADALDTVRRDQARDRRQVYRGAEVGPRDGGDGIRADFPWLVRGVGDDEDRGCLPPDIDSIDPYVRASSADREWPAVDPAWLRQIERQEERLRELAGEMKTAILEGVSVCDRVAADTATPHKPHPVSE